MDVDPVQKQQENDMVPNEDRKTNEMVADEEQNDENKQPNEEGDPASKEGGPASKKGDAALKYVPKYDGASFKAYLDDHIEIYTEQIERVKEAKERILQGIEKVKSVEKEAQSLIDRNK